MAAGLLDRQYQEGVVFTIGNTIVSLVLLQNCHRTEYSSTARYGSQSAGPPVSGGRDRTTKWPPGRNYHSPVITKFSLKVLRNLVNLWLMIYGAYNRGPIHSHVTSSTNIQQHGTILSWRNLQDSCKETSMWILVGKTTQSKDFITWDCWDRWHWYGDCFFCCWNFELKIIQKIMLFSLNVCQLCS